MDFRKKEFDLTTHFYSFPSTDSYISMTGINGKTYYLFMEVGMVTYKPLQVLKQALAKRTVDAPFVKVHTTPNRTSDNETLANIELMVTIDNKETAVKLNDGVYQAVQRIHQNSYGDSTPTLDQDLATAHAYFNV